MPRFTIYVWKCELVASIHRVHPFTDAPKSRLATVPPTYAPWLCLAHMLLTLPEHASEAIVK